MTEAWIWNRTPKMAVTSFYKKGSTSENSSKTWEMFITPTNVSRVSTIRTSCSREWPKTVPCQQPHWSDHLPKAPSKTIGSSLFKRASMKTREFRFRNKINLSMRALCKGLQNAPRLKMRRARTYMVGRGRSKWKPLARLDLNSNKNNSSRANKTSKKVVTWNRSILGLTYLVLHPSK